MSPLSDDSHGSLDVGKADPVPSVPKLPIFPNFPSPWPGEAPARRTRGSSPLNQPRIRKYFVPRIPWPSPARCQHSKGKAPVFCFPKNSLKSCEGGGAARAPLPAAVPRLKAGNAIAFTTEPSPGAAPGSFIRSPGYPRAGASGRIGAGSAVGCFPASRSCGES